MDTNYAARGGSPEGVRESGSAMPASRGRAVWSLRAAFVVALLLQAYLLYGYVPGPPSDVVIPHLDKVAHLGMFALPAFLGVLARLRPWLVSLILVVHAPVSELVQHQLVPGRTGDPMDLLADLLGIAVGLGLGMLVLRRFSPATGGDLRP